jgi:hypothetical protein
MCHVLDREHSQSRKYLQLSNDKLVHAELALRFWREHQNLYVWARIPLFVRRADYRCLELALIQGGNPGSTILLSANFSPFEKNF